LLNLVDFLCTTWPLASLGDGKADGKSCKQPSTQVGDQNKEKTKKKEWSRMTSQQVDE